MLEGAVLGEIARVLGCELSAEALALCVRLCEAGVNPEALAAVVCDLQASSVQQQPRL